MQSSGFRVTKARFIAFIGLATLICIFNITSALSQTQVPSPIKIGVRLAVPPIANVRGIVGGQEEFGGFCYLFGKELESQLNRTYSQNPPITVAFRVIKNEYRGSKNPRWGSLLTDNPNDRQDIQCGPNSKQDIQNNEIVFSSSNFFETGTKLFLKQDTLNKYFSNQSQKKLADLLDVARAKMKIGVVRETTTFERLKSSGYDAYPFDIRDRALDDTRDSALDALKEDRIQAFASDAIILRALLDEKSGGRTYRDLGYVIFPSEDYLNGKTEKYAIAISNKDANAQYSLTLLTATNQVLSQPKFEEERKGLEQYEKGQPSVILSPTGQGRSDPKPPEKPPEPPKGNEGWVQIAVAVITAAATVAAAYWQSHSRRNRRG